jgi:nitronate monooxygenase
MSPVAALLGLRYPLLLAPMAAVSGGRLAAAVSRAGGLGLIGGGYGDRAWLVEQLRLCAGQPFGVGFITWALRRSPGLLELALQAQPRAVLLSFGELAEAGRRTRDAGVVLIAQVQTVRQAREAVAQGAQIVVAQGGEAGGHGGLRGTLALVPAVVDAVAPVPVVAAGGIADGRGLAAALMLGAAGALCGTAFYACDESLADAAAKRRLVEASGDDTAKGPLFDLLRGLAWPAGPWALRTLRNRHVDRWADDLDGLRADLPAQQALLVQARARGDFDIAPVIAGEAADLVRARRPAAEVVGDLVRRCIELLGPDHPLALAHFSSHPA